MSFLRPDAIAKFAFLQSFLLWFQMAYSVWQFVRTAKFFRLPYVTVSSTWHGFDSWYKKRKIILMCDDLNVDKDALPDAVPLDQLPAGMTVDAIGDCNFKVSFTDIRPPFTCLTTRHRAVHMKLLRESSRTDPLLQFGRDDDLLWPAAHLIRRLSFDEAMSHVLSGKGYSTFPQVVCFFDYSSRELLNQNFVRFSSIWPLILQARHFDFWSAIFSICIIAMDLLSYGANKFWKFVQNRVSRFVKLAISYFSKRERREFLFAFMATISTQFKCGNFVTLEASPKVVKQVLLATHIRLDDSKVATLDPILSTIAVPRKVGSQTAAQSIPYTMAGIRYSVKAEPALSAQPRSSVHFRQHNIKLKDWAEDDMAYFLQVCDYCDRFRSSPIKELDEDNAVCSSFAEIVEGVKPRSFVLCEFKTKQRLFFT